MKAPSGTTFFRLATPLVRAGPIGLAGVKTFLFGRRGTSLMENHLYLACRQ